MNIYISEDLLIRLKDFLFLACSSYYFINIRKYITLSQFTYGNNLNSEIAY